MAKLLIVGIDPGTTLGYAFLDLSGKLVHVGSIRGGDKFQLITKIRGVGTPVLFATDVSPAPDFVTKVAASFNSKVFEPGKDMTEREKNEMARGFAVENAHERDSIACALKAFHQYENKFRQVNSLIRSTKIEGREDEIKAMVLEGLSMKNAIRELEEGDAPRIIDAPKPQPKIQIDPELQRKNEKIRVLASSNEELRRAVDRLETEKKQLQEKLLSLQKGIYERVLKEKEVRKRDAKILLLVSHRRKKKSRKSASPDEGELGKREEKSGPANSIEREKTRGNGGEQGERLSDLKSLSEKVKKDDEVDIESIIRNYRQKSQ